MPHRVDDGHPSEELDRYIAISQSIGASALKSRRSHRALAIRLAATGSASTTFDGKCAGGALYPAPAAYAARSALSLFRLRLADAAAGMHS